MEQADLSKMRALCELGQELSITGGIVPEDIYLFEGTRAKTFIAGRALAFENGQATAEALRREINKYWLMCYQPPPDGDQSLLTIN
ncbi:hypothetical protein ACK32A_04190 [Aeromonas enteropelogenes]|uniref:hypothetical protein n=1 Tax=Aeromonas enteropelogenes TaxID=29489 RepID=UPI0039894478